MDGTVNCAKREDGRPALAGTAAAAVGAATFSTPAGASAEDFDLEETVVCIGLADVLETDMGAGLATARGLDIAGFESDGMGFLTTTVFGLTTTLAAGLTGNFALTFSTGLAVFLAGSLATGLAVALATGLAVGLGATLATVATFFTAPLATGLAGALLATFAAGFVGLLGLATGFAAGLAGADALVFVAAALLSFPDLAFTSCLLADVSCAWSVGPADPALPFAGFFGGPSPARECTGFPLPKPIRCKIETIIWGLSD